MKTRKEYTKEEFIKETILLWEEAVRFVYLKDPKDYAKDIAEEAWNYTNMTPFQYVSRIADPDRFTNQIIRGQKARQIRWKKWKKLHNK